MSSYLFAVPARLQTLVLIAISFLVTPTVTLSEDPGNNDLRVQLLEKISEAKKHLDEDRPQEALPLLDEVLQEDATASWPERYLAFYHRGKAHFAQNTYAKAIEDFSSALEQMPTAPDRNDERSQIFFDRGLAYDRLNNLDQAISDYSATINLYPGSMQALNNRAVAAYKLKRFSDAIRDMTSYLESDSEWPGAYFIRGLARIETGDRIGVTDLKIAAGMGHELAQEALRKANIEW